jgi:lysophospholipase L1-like esterase
MTTVSTITTFTLSKGQVAIFERGGKGTANVDPTGRANVYTIGEQEAFLGPYDKAVSIVVTPSSPVSYRIDSDKDMSDQSGSLKGALVLNPTTGLQIGGSGLTPAEQAAVRAGMGASLSDAFAMQSLNSYYINGFSPAEIFASDDLGDYWVAANYRAFKRADTHTPIKYPGAAVGFVVGMRGLPGANPKEVCGANVVTNGDFSSATGWTLGEGWGVSGGKASRTTASGLSNITGVGLTVGDLYLVRIKIDALSTGSFVRVYVGTGYQADIYATGVTELFARCTSTNSIIIQCRTPEVTCAVDYIECLPIVGSAPALSNGSSLSPLNMAGGYFKFDGVDDVLNAYFSGSLGTAATVAYCSLAGVTVLTAQTVDATYALPTANWYSCFVINRALTASETSALTNWMLAQRDAARYRTIAIDGDSIGAGDAATTTDARWSNLLAVAIGDPNSVYNGSVGGSSSSDVLTRMQTDTIYRKSVRIILDKPNTGEVAETWLANIAKMVATQYTGRFLVISPTNGSPTDERAGGVYYAMIVALNAALLARYPDNYLDARSYLVNFGLAHAGIAPTSQDLIDVADDTIPASLRADTVHLNDYGQAVLADIVEDWLKDRGWLPA